MHLGNTVYSIVKLFESSLPDTRSAEGAEMKAEIVSDIGDFKQFQEISSGLLFFGLPKRDVHPLVSKDLAVGLLLVGSGSRLCGGHL